MKREHSQLVLSWIADLASLTAGQMPLADLKTKIAALAAALAREFPQPDTFTSASLHAVGKA